jgi:hypothetical protein
MKQNAKWLKITAIAVSYPSTIFTCAWLIDWLVSKGHLSASFGKIILVLVILNSLFLMVYYAYKKKG